MAKAKNYGVEVTHGMRVSGAKPSQMDYSSETESPKIWSFVKGSVITDASGNGSASVPHGLTYAPALMAYYKNTDGKWYAAGSFNMIAETDRANVTVRATSAAHSTTYKFKVYVLTDPAQLI